MRGPFAFAEARSGSIAPLVSEATFEPQITVDTVSKDTAITIDIKEPGLLYSVQYQNGPRQTR